MAVDAASIAITALALTDQEQQDYLSQACSGDIALLESVNKLMRASQQADQFFSGLAARTGLPDRDEAPTAIPSQAFGVYRLLRPLGEGGMGAVYLAERNDAQFEQQVAIKTLPPGFTTGALQARFLQERQILARLNHPHIAGLLDGGVAEDGTPFLAMEYVDGQRIDQYCDGKQLSLRQRVELFLNVCDGVDYAHRNLVVHRDLKPDNVLVDADGNAKLLDFGIAKLMDDEQAQSLTQVAGSPLTPRYASPEQLTGGTVNVATDLYALGVLLYELLTGLSPYGENLEGSTLRSAITEGNVVLPRTALSKLASQNGEQYQALALARGLRGNKLADAFKGDLTSALLKALSRSAESRYVSVDALAGDLRAWLSNRPLQAAGGTTGYLLRKFFRRNRLAVTSAALGALALAAVAIIATTYSIESARQNTVIKAERDRAEHIQNFLLSVFSLNSPNETKGASVSAKELLDRGAQRVDEELADQPRARAEIKLEIAAVYGQLGLRSEGEALLRTAATQQRQEFGSNSETYANTLERLAEFVEMSGQYDEALALAEESLQISRSLDNVVLLSYNLVRVARIQHLQGKYEVVAPLYQEAIELQQDYYGPDSSETAETLMHYGGLLQHQGKHVKAEAVLRRALGIMRKTFGEDHTMTMSALINVAPTLASQGRYDEALQALDQAFAISNKILGADHPDNRYILNHQGHTLMRAQRLDEASTKFLQAAELVAASMGTEHPDYSVMVRSQADVLLRQENYALALTLYQQADRVLSALLQDNPSYWDMHRRMAQCLRFIGDLDSAADKIEQVLEVQQRLLQPDHPLRQKALAEGIAIHQLTGNQERLTTLESQVEAQLTSPAAD